MRVTLALMLVALAGRAQSLPEPQREAPPQREEQKQEEITPPKLISETPAPYPAGAAGAARVVQQVDVDVQGLSQKLSVVSAAQPLFDEAPLRAAQSLRFEPAKRGVTPIAVRIQYA